MLQVTKNYSGPMVIVDHPRFLTRAEPWVLHYTPQSLVFFLLQNFTTAFGVFVVTKTKEEQWTF